MPVLIDSDPPPPPSAELRAMAQVIAQERAEENLGACAFITIADGQLPLVISDDLVPVLRGFEPHAARQRRILRLLRAVAQELDRAVTVLDTQGNVTVSVDPPRACTACGNKGAAPCLTCGRNVHHDGI